MSPGSGGSSSEKTGWPGRSSRGTPNRLSRGRPQLVDRALLADDHPRARALDAAREAVAALARGNDVRAEVAERGEPVVSAGRDEPAQPAPGDVLEEDALDRLARAEREDLLEPRFEKLSHR